MRKALIAMILLLLAGCGGGTSTVQVQQGPGELTVTPVVDTGSILLGVLKDASGVPQGVRITWTQSTASSIDGYWIYRDTSAIPSGDPAGNESLRVTGSLIADDGDGGSQYHDDLFSCSVGSTYYYAITAVNDTGDESDFSDDQDITIAQHTISSITTTAVSIGDTVTINGNYFGSSQGSDKVYFTNATGTTNVEAASYTSWDMTELVVTVPYGAADGRIGVEVGGTNVYSVDNISYNEPAITNVSPVEDWEQHNDVTITGTDFGPAPGSGGSSSYVKFDSTSAASGDITSWTDTQIEVKVPTGVTADVVDITVDVAGNVSGTEQFTILPHIAGLNSYSGNTGDAVTLSGSHFAATQGSGSVTVAGISATVNSWNAGTVNVSIPSTATDGDVVLTRDDGKVTNGLGYDVIPVITSISPARRVAGEGLTINGTGFGGTRGGSTVTFDGGSVVATTYTSWSATQIVVEVPAGCSTGTVTVNIDDDPVGSDNDSATSSSSVTVVLAPPVIDDLGQL